MSDDDEKTSPSGLLVKDLLKIDKKYSTERPVRGFLYGSVTGMDSHGRVVVQGNCVDISVSGVGMIVTRGGVSRGQTLRFDIVSPKKTLTLTATAKVARIVRLEDQSYLVGLAFESLSPLSLKKIGDYLDHLPKEGFEKKPGR